MQRGHKFDITRWHIYRPGNTKFERFSERIHNDVSSRKLHLHCSRYLAADPQKQKQSHSKLYLVHWFEFGIGDHVRVASHGGWIRTLALIAIINSISYQWFVKDSSLDLLLIYQFYWIFGPTSNWSIHRVTNYPNMLLSVGSPFHFGGWL